MKDSIKRVIIGKGGFNKYALFYEGQLKPIM